MAEWWQTLSSYRLHDLLMFSPRVHARLFELVNAQAGPLVWIAAALPLGVGLAVHRGSARAHAGAALLVSLALALVAEWHLRRTLAEILWIAPAWAFAFAAASLAWLAWAVMAWRAPVGAAQRTAGRSTSSARALALLLACLALVWPLLAPLQGRPWLQAEVAGLAPEPTVLLALSLLTVLGLREAVWWLLALAPLAWCLFAGLMLQALQAPQAALPPLAAMAVMAARAMSLLKRPAMAPSASSRRVDSSCAAADGPHQRAVTSDNELPR